MSPPTRREVLLGTTLLAAAVIDPARATEPAPAKPKLKILVTGGHPDDPETGCGGTIARYAEAGHEVVIVYLTRGEAGIKRKTHDEAAAIRSAEAEKACQILGARPVFAGQIDGATEITPERYDAFAKIIAAEKPNIVFTHWPVDTHRDHRACSLLTYDAWLKSGKAFALFYYEVDLGAQTQCFRTTDYVDVTAVETKKRDACYAHESQHPSGPKGFYDQEHMEMMKHRGMESGRKLAEAFMRHEQGPQRVLPDRGGD